MSLSAASRTGGTQGTTVLYLDPESKSKVIQSPSTLPVLSGAEGLGTFGSVEGWPTIPFRINEALGYTAARAASKSSTPMTNLVFAAR